MPGIRVDDMQWSDIEDELKAFSHSRDNQYVLINPENGHRIEDENVQVSVIGLTTEASHQTRKYGFNLPGSTKSRKSDENEPDTRQYEPEAWLYLSPDPELLPDDLRNQKVWAIVAEDDKLMKLYYPVAEFLFATFGVQIYITAKKVKDSDPDHAQSRPVNAKYPDVLPYCPVYFPPKK